MMAGQKVVCINDTFPEAAKLFYKYLPVKGVTYVIREVVLGINWKCEPGEVCLYLVGMHNPTGPPPACAERGFNAERFRPLEDDRIRDSKELAIHQ